MRFEQHAPPAADEPCVDLFLLCVADLEPAWSWLRNLLHPSECERAAGFAVAGAREEFVVGRGVLRLLLSERTGIPPRVIGFRYGTGGKPELIQSTAKPLAFNVSHSHGVVAIVVGNVRAVGIDVERIDLGAPVVDLAHVAWGPAAAASMGAFTCARERSRAFFRQWVRFEAAGKYHGNGVLALPGPADESQQEEGLTQREFTHSIAGEDYIGCVVTPRFTRLPAGKWLTLDALDVLRDPHQGGKLTNGSPGAPVVRAHGPMPLP